MEKEVQKLQQEYEALHQLRDLENKIKAMKDQLMWAFVKEKEKNIGNFDLDISSKRKQLEKAANSIDKIKVFVVKCIILNSVTNKIVFRLLEIKLINESIKVMKS